MRAENMVLLAGDTRLLCSPEVCVLFLQRPWFTLSALHGSPGPLISTLLTLPSHLRMSSSLFAKLFLSLLPFR